MTTSTSTIGVAVGTAGAAGVGEAGAANEIVTDRRHAEELAPLIATTLAEAGATMGEIELFVVDVGPGRFTGLRVGLATVRALALATGRGVVALTSLEILAAAELDRPLLAVIDARRGEVFQQPFGVDGPSGPPVVGPPGEVAPRALDGTGVVVVGDGSDRYAELYGPGHRPGRAPSPAVMLGSAGGREALPGSKVEPLYLREPDIDINVKTRHTPR